MRVEGCIGKAVEMRSVLERRVKEKLGRYGSGLKR